MIVESGKQNPPRLCAVDGCEHNVTELLRRADRIEEQATVAWRDGNTTAATGLIRLARRLRLHAREEVAA